jgi:Na+/H+-dicarboxylate symporter
MKKLNLTTKIITALILGTITGLLLNIFAPDVFTVLNTYLFVPLVFLSIILGSAGLGNPQKLGRIGLKTVVYFLATTCFAIIIGLALATIVQPGTAGDFDTEGAEFSSEEAPPVNETLMNIILKNPITAMSEGDMLQIIVFPVFIGLALTALGEKTKGILSFVEQGDEIMMYLVSIVMKFAPYTTFGLIATAIGSQGFSAIRAMGAYMLVVVAALIIHSIVTYAVGRLRFWLKNARSGSLKISPLP